ncbi:hypothetical protein ACHAP1_008494 [Verticillium nonalfalfae]
MAAQSKPVNLAPWGRAVAGASGAVLANALVYPLDILQVQVKARPTKETGNVPDAAAEAAEPHYSSTWDALSKIAAEDGIQGLYAGMSGSLLGVASTNFAYFYWYSIVRTFYIKSAKTTAPPSTITELALGAVAGAVAQLCTIPVAVVTTRQQTQRKGERKGFWETGREVVEGSDGVFGLWRGLKASLVLVVNPAITYGAYERLKEGKPFSSFIEVMQFILEREGPLGLFKGIAPQILKGLLVQGILMMTKER